MGGGRGGCEDTLGCKDAQWGWGKPMPGGDGTSLNFQRCDECLAGPKMLEPEGTLVTSRLPSPCLTFLGGPERGGSLLPL